MVNKENRNRLPTRQARPPLENCVSVFKWRLRFKRIGACACFGAALLAMGFYFGSRYDLLLAATVMVLVFIGSLMFMFLAMIGLEFVRIPPDYRLEEDRLVEEGGTCASR